MSWRVLSFGVGLLGTAVLAALPSSGTKAETAGPDPRGVLTTKCVSCHGATNPAAGLDLSKGIDSLAALREVVPSRPHASSLYKVVADGSMPKGGTMLSPTEIATIRDWILSLRPDPTALFKAKCISCHGATGAAAQLDLSGSVKQLAKLPQVTFGEAGPMDSTLYKRVADGSMPKGGPKLTESEMMSVRDFVSSTHPDVKPIINAKCISCHGATNPAAGLDLTGNLDGLKQVTKGKPAVSALYLRVADGTMPKGGKPLTDSEAGVFWDWIASLKPTAENAGGK